MYASIGDLIKVRSCKDLDNDGFPDCECDCFFCRGRSNRIGLILGPLPNDSYEVAFDAGVLQIYDHEFGSGQVVVISEGW